MALSKQDLALAQFLKGAYEGSQKYADMLDPKRKYGHVPGWRRSDVVVALDSIARRTSEAFRTLTGRSPEDVPIFDLNTERPAAWTKEVAWPTDRLE